MDIGRAVQMRVDRDDAIHKTSEQPANDLLADRFARLKGSVLPHVAEIGRDQNEPLGAIAPQRFGGEQERDKFFVRPIERRIDDRDGAAGPTVTPQFPVGKPVYRDFVHAATPSRAASRLASLARRRQALNDDRAHGVVSPTGRSLPVDQIAGVGFRGGHRKIEFRLIEGIDAIERLAFLDAITDLLEDPDAGALVDRRARRFGRGG